MATFGLLRLRETVEFAGGAMIPKSAQGEFEITKGSCDKEKKDKVNVMIIFIKLTS